MCAIIDRNAAIVVFGRNPPEASVEFINWINEGKVKLVVGGKLLDELETTGAREWVHQGINSGLIITENDETVRDMTAGHLSRLLWHDFGTYVYILQ